MKSYVGMPTQLPSKSPCAMVVGGVHGNETAGVAAILSHGAFPDYCLVVPSANTLGLTYGRRYGDIDAYLAAYDHLVELAGFYRPKLILNLHEDDECWEYRGAYVYHYGINKLLPHIVLDAIVAAGLQISPTEDKTWESERISRGIIASPDDTPTDPSIDYWANKNIGTEVIVVETPSNVWPAKARMRAHMAALNALPDMWALVSK